MKDELKTLKDIQGKALNTDIVLVSRLKQEAIKWVKGLNNGIKDKRDRLNVIAIEDWIKLFFNLTRKDLK